MHVHKPVKSGSDWTIKITETISPLSKVIESIPCGSSRESAWQAYRQIKKRSG